MKSWSYLWENGVRSKEKVRFINVCQFTWENKITNIILYFLAQFVNRYLHTNWPKLIQKKLDTPEGIKQDILTRSTI